ncbi:MAG: NYN domain-containing protein [Clostridia bacterium]|nr:NYN domain-containing protein [Clostridia bacterium]
MNRNDPDVHIAVLIDAENVSASYVRPLLEEVALYGTPTVKRIYADWTSSLVSGWKPVLLENAINPVQQYSYTQGKNSSDSAMIIDAMDILYTKDIDTFCIVSSDSDFTRLCTRLREAGKRVIGIGEQKTPRAFIQSCDKFIFIDLIANDSKKTAAQPAKKQSAQKQTQSGKSSTGEQNKQEQQSDGSKRSRRRSGGAKAEAAEAKEAAAPAKEAKEKSEVPEDVTQLLTDAVSAAADEDGWAFLADVGNLLLKIDPSFDSRNYGFRKLTPLLAAAGQFEIDSRPTENSHIKHIFIRKIDN